MVLNLPEATGVVASLRQRHAALAERTVAGSAPSTSDRQDLVDDLVQAGAAVPPGADRDALRNVLYFWCGDQAACGERDRAASLPALLPYAAPGPTLSPAMTRVSVPATPGATLALEAGAMPNDAEARRIVRLSALAREWRLTDAGHKRGYLINDAATLAEAARYAVGDPEIVALVDASRVELKASTRWHRTLVTALVTGALLGLLTLVAVLWLSRRRAEGEAKTLRAAQTQLLTDRTGGSDQARAAIDDLQQGDLNPLVALLGKIANVDPVKLGRLQLRPDAPPVPPRTGLSEDPRRPRRAEPDPANPAATSAPPAFPPGPTCEGWLLLAEDGISRLTDQRDPVALKLGDVATLALSGELRLRPVGEAGPGDNRWLGIIRAGAPVRLLGTARHSLAQAGRSWAEVALPRADCIRIFLQYFGAADRTEAPLAALRAIDFQVPSAERVASAKGLAEIRYFNTEDKTASLQAAEALARFNGGTRLRVLGLTNYPKKPAPGVIEAWLDLDH